MSRRTRRSQLSAVRRFLSLFPLIPLVASLVAIAHVALADLGQWSNAVNWNRGNSERYAVHLMILRGDGNPHHSRILFFKNHLPDSMLGGQWGWTPGNYDCSTFPEGNFELLESPKANFDLFCSGHAAVGDTGQVLVASGTHPVIQQYGENKARVLTPGRGATGIGDWTTLVPPNMKHWRWYATVATLASGKGLVVSGSNYPRHRLLFGDRNGSPPASPLADSVQLFAPLPDGAWDTPVLPVADWNDGRPTVRAGHSATNMAGILGFNGLTIFGGTDANGPTNDAWRLFQQKNYLGDRQTYEWVKIDAGGGSQQLRTSHTGVAFPEASMNLVVFGGLDENNDPIAAPRRLSFDSSQLTYTWNLIQSGNAPSARYGHAAFYDETQVGTELRKRMIVFGGASTYNGTPTDQNVYELRFNPSDPTNPTWHTMPRVELGDGQPAARLWHTLTPDSSIKRSHILPEHQNAKTALLYGGKLGNLSYSAELWALWLFTNGTYGWERRSGTGTGPGARARHSAVLDPDQGGSRLYVFGGETVLGSSVVPADSRMYIVDTWNTNDPGWKQWSDLGFSLAGHTATIDPLGEIARIPEVYNPATNSWTEHVNAPLFENSYPPIFIVPGASNGGSRVINFNHDNKKTYWTDFPASGQASAWTELTSGTLPTRVATGVQYLPGRIMVAGGTDITGRTFTFNTTDLGNAWVETQSMEPRTHHNLVLLPTGQVLAVGGNAQFNHTSGLPVKRPQVWTPGANGTGTWSSMDGSDRLAQQNKIRGYHSTAILLPDGRVLSTSGEGNDPNGEPAQSDKRTAEIFCPPYLFKANGDPITARPVIQGVPATVTWNTAFSVCVEDTANIRSACLIRAPSTTHGLDMNQRFIPLTILAAKGSPMRLHLTTPESAPAAPPGDYMLFLLGSTDGDNVPSIAKWLRVNSSTTPAPDELSLSADLITCDAIGPIRWAAPSDAGCASRALDYDLRYSFSPINSGNFLSATPLAAIPDPATGGTQQTAGTLSGLSPNTLVYLAGRTRSSAGNWSPLAYTELATLGSCGGGGYGTSAGRTRDEDVTGSPRRRAEENSLSGAATLRLVGEFTAGASLGWTLLYLDFAGDEARLTASARDLVLEEQGESNSWEFRNASAVPGASAGVRALSRPGRLIFPAGTALESIESAPRRFVINEVEHSRAGEIETGESGEVPISLVAGDTVEVRFRPGSSTGEGEDCVLFVRLPGVSGSSARRRSRGPAADSPPAETDAEAMPMSFALHPARPNPSSGEMTVSFDVPVATRVRIEVFDVQGRRVATLLDQPRMAGRHFATWNGRREGRGAAVAGVYLCRMTAGSFVAERRVTRLP